MGKVLFHDALQPMHWARLLTISALAVLVALECLNATAWGQTADLAIRPTFREPVTLASKDGVLEVRLTARQGQATLDTVAAPVQNLLVFDYELIRGEASDGKTSGRNLYPAPTSDGSPMPLAPTGWLGSGSSSTIALISTGVSSTPGIL